MHASDLNLWTAQSWFVACAVLAVKREKMYESICPSDFFPAGGGAAQVPYGNAPVIPTGLEGKSRMCLQLHL